jgi:hypothetical protein
MESLACLAGGMLALQLAACTPAAAAPATPAADRCITDYRNLPDDHGWRRYRIVDGRRCWYVGGHGARRDGVTAHTQARHHHVAAQVARFSAPPAPPPIIAPAPADNPTQRVERTFRAVDADADARLYDQVRRLQLDEQKMGTAPKSDFLLRQQDRDTRPPMRGTMLAGMAALASLIALALGIMTWRSARRDAAGTLLDGRLSHSTGARF